MTFPHYWLVFTFSLAGVANKPLRSGSMPPSSMILHGLKKALCRGKWPSGIGWKVAFNRWRMGLIKECPNLKNGKSCYIISEFVNASSLYFLFSPMAKLLLALWCSPMPSFGTMRVPHLNTSSKFTAASRVLSKLNQFLTTEFKFHFESQNLPASLLCAM